MKKFILAGLAVWPLPTPSFAPAQRDRSEKIAVATSGKAPGAITTG